VSAIRIAYTVLLTVALSGALTFIVLYAIRTPKWWRTPTGRWLMAVPGMLVMLIASALLARVLHLPPVVWMVTLAGFDFVTWWGVALLIGAQRKGENEERSLR
jgi:peptidoglycan biosynthesis protein MviN/MurJ (putative lipid II flippase)